MRGSWKAVAGIGLLTQAVTVAGPTMPAVAAETAVPAGFTDAVVASVPSPTAIGGLPDGRIVVLSQTGDVRIISGGALLATPALHLSVCSAGERGLLGFAADPGFAGNGQVYLFYTRPEPAAAGQCVNRTSRFTMAGNTIDPASEVVLIDNVSARNGNHNAGDLAVGGDGFLYISTGDAGTDPRTGASPSQASQDPSLLNGKILRIDRFTGAPATGNPFTGAGSAVCATRGNTAATPMSPCREIFALGLRNPYRFAFDPNSRGSRFFVNDVGQSTREEIDLGTLGANYGWPIREGSCPIGQNPPCAPAAAQFTDPLFDYGRSDGQYITGGAFVPDGTWPGSYDGAYLFADGGAQRIFLRTASGAVDMSAPFATVPGVVAHLEFITTGGQTALYYTLAGTSAGSVHAISADIPPPPPAGGLVYVPDASAERVLDTRDPAIGGPNPMQAGSTRRVALDRAGVPAGAAAAFVNLTAVTPQANGYLTAWAPRTAMPPTSNLNVLAGEVVANAAVVPLTDGAMMLYTLATTHVIVDVMGFYVPGGASAAGRFQRAGPVRVLDTRLPQSPTNAFLLRASDAGSTATVPILGRGLPLPAAGVQAVVVDVTAVSAGPDGGFLTAYPTGGPLPPVSNVNVDGPGDVRANLAIVPLGAGGAIDLRMAFVPDAVVDLVGYITDASATATGGRLELLPATRVLDTRQALGSGPLGAGETSSLNPAAVPDGAAAVLQNTVLVIPAGPTFLTTWPAGQTLPTVSSNNAVAPGQLRAALTVTSLGAGGAIAYYSLAATDLVVDVTGYFT